MTLKKILIVDDEESILETMYQYLKGNGVEVIKCSEITAAEFVIDKTFIDVIIADIRLTGVLGREGLELLSYVHEKSPGTEVIIMTGYGSPEIEQEAYEKGAYLYFDKPIDLRVLSEHLKKLEIHNNLPKKLEND